jgi:uncharacterized protein YjbI with pentapeptide repeats
MEIKDRAGKLIHKSDDSRDFSELDLRNAVFTGMLLQGAVFDDSNLAGASFRRADLYWSNFFRGDPTGGRLGGSATPRR